MLAVRALGVLGVACMVGVRVDISMVGVPPIAVQFPCVVSITVGVVAAEVNHPRQRQPQQQDTPHCQRQGKDEVPPLQ
jgi:hypothetical protein